MAPSPKREVSASQANIAAALPIAKFLGYGLFKSTTQESFYLL